MRHLLADDDLSPLEQADVLELAARLKAQPLSERTLAGPVSVATLYDKPTLRTQTSFAAGIAELGGHSMLVDGSLAGVGTRESIADVARVLGRQAGMVVWRTFAQADLEEMAEYAGVPVVNALTDLFHPCQLLADLLTVREHLGDPAGRTAALIGDGASNMAHSWLLAGATAGMHVRICAPAGHQPEPAIVLRAEKIAADTGGSISVGGDPQQAAEAADVIVTDTWISMGQEGEAAQRLESFAPYQVDAALMALAAPHAILLHCLPAYRGKEVTADVLDGPQSVIWDEAENRRHAQKAILSWLWERR